jgi:anthranilate synthase component I
LDDFLAKASSGSTIGIYREILADMETPVSAFRKIADNEYAFLLESVEGGERLARYSFLGSGTNKVIRSKNNNLDVMKNGSSYSVNIKSGKDMLDVLEDEFKQIKYISNPSLPKFCGGAVGYLGYDGVRFFEELPVLTDDDLNMPDCLFFFTDSLLIFDHVQHKIKIVVNAEIGDNPEEDYNNAIIKIEEIMQKLRKPYPYHNNAAKESELEIKSNFSKEDFKQAVEKCKEYILDGDIIQAVLSQRFQTPISCDSFDIYRALRSLNPSPYMYYLVCDDIKLIGSSPEILVTANDGIVTTRPIAGTRPRGLTSEEDSILQAELISDQKELAEHIMLVDLGRNDIGRVSKFGSVEVNELMQIERYSHVMHIVSNVKGELDDNHNQFDVLRSCFPAGTVSGAPKIRAMEIIEELEPTRRGSYAGCIGYFSYSGNMDTCITIRTIMVKDGIAYIQAGAGIVADSVPENEYLETQNKAMAMVNAIKEAHVGLE